MRTSLDEVLTKNEALNESPWFAFATENQIRRQCYEACTQGKLGEPVKFKLKMLIFLGVLLQALGRPSGLL